MDFLIPSGLQPSNSLYMEYAQSEVTKILTLKTREFYNEMSKKFFKDKKWDFTEDDQMSEEAYDRLKERYCSRPPFVFFFNPTIQLEQFTEHGLNYVGYAIKRDKGFMVSINFKS